MMGLDEAWDERARGSTANPPPWQLVDMQLDKRVFDKALVTHTLPFQNRFHNSNAQLHRPT